MRRALFRTAIADLLPRVVLERSSKLLPAPTVFYQRTMDRDLLSAERRRVATSLAASAVFDLAEVERHLASLPAPEAVAEAIRASAAMGRQFRDPRSPAISKPFIFARARSERS